MVQNTLDGRCRGGHSTVERAFYSMDSPGTVSLNAALNQLKTNWKKLQDVDRGRAIGKLHADGFSWRTLARELDCSESYLRQLDRAAQAPVADQLLARQGKISTRQLVRRARDAEKLRAAQEQQVLEEKRSKAAAQAAVEICNWFEECQLWPAHGENIIDEARRIFAANDANGALPKYTAPRDTPLDQIIERTRPKPPKADPEPFEVGSVGWYAEWLARWAFFAYPDAEVRDRALGLAYNAQVRGKPLGNVRKKK